MGRRLRAVEPRTAAEALDDLDAALAAEADALRAMAATRDALRGALRVVLSERGGGAPDSAPYLSLAEAATALGLSRDFVRRALERGELRGVRVGNRWRISRTALEVPR